MFVRIRNDIQIVILLSNVVCLHVCMTGCVINNSVSLCSHITEHLANRKSVENANFVIMNIALEYEPMYMYSECEPQKLNKVVCIGKVSYCCS